ncbi:hypothetical protein M5K25_006445 [Dendrobium thyrsiflorum]|uniref:Uncharacterized protein n=1 Tax=Dendrobium thyrsiflorum TaxID=117978 RepID=A0ABD0VB93_DENTH
MSVEPEEVRRDACDEAGDPKVSFSVFVTDRQTTYTRSSPARWDGKPAFETCNKENPPIKTQKFMTKPDPLSGSLALLENAASNVEGRKPQFCISIDLDPSAAILSSCQDYQLSQTDSCSDPKFPQKESVAEIRPLEPSYCEHVKQNLDDSTPNNQNKSKATKWSYVGIIPASAVRAFIVENTHVVEVGSLQPPVQFEASYGLGKRAVIPYLSESKDNQRLKHSSYRQERTEVSKPRSKIRTEENREEMQNRKIFIISCGDKGNTKLLGSREEELAYDLRKENSENGFGRYGRTEMEMEMEMEMEKQRSLSVMKQ